MLTPWLLMTGSFRCLNVAARSTPQFTISADSSFGAALRFLLFLYMFHCHDGFGFGAHTARHCCICKFYPFMSIMYLITSQDRVFDLPGGR